MASARERARRRRKSSALARTSRRSSTSARRPQWRSSLRYALINPNWSFEGSIYFGCREPHLPLEYGYARALLRQAGHTAEIFDAHAEAVDSTALADRVADFAPEMIVVTTAPSYLFWRCAPPELRV